jgi:hypothetical protein
MNKDYSAFFNLDNKGMELKLSENGKYCLRYFENSNYLHFGKSIFFEIKEKDIFEIAVNDKKESLLYVQLFSWDPYVCSSWIGIYKSDSISKSEDKKNFDYFTYYYIPNNKWNINLSRSFSSGDYEVRLFKNKFDIDNFVQKKTFTL